MSPRRGAAAPAPAKKAAVTPEVRRRGGKAATTPAEPAGKTPDEAHATGGGTGTPHAVPMPPSSGSSGAKKG